MQKELRKRTVSPIELRKVIDASDGRAGSLPGCRQRFSMSEREVLSRLFARSGCWSRLWSRGRKVAHWSRGTKCGLGSGEARVVVLALGREWDTPWSIVQRGNGVQKGNRESVKENPEKRIGSNGKLPWNYVLRKTSVSMDSQQQWSSIRVSRFNSSK